MTKKHLTDVELRQTLCDPTYVAASPRHDQVQDAFDRLMRERDAAIRERTAALLKVEELDAECEELDEECEDFMREKRDRLQKLRNDAIGVGASAVVLSAVTWALLFVPAAEGHSWGTVGLTALLVAMPNVLLGMSLAYLGLWARGGR